MSREGREVRPTNTSIGPPSERERILQAMAELCLERGYQQTSVEALVERAGSSEQAFRKHFRDVEDCMIAAMNWITSQVLAEMVAGYSADLAESESLMRGAKSILELMAAHPSFAYLGYVGARQMATPELSQVYRTGVQMLAVVMQRLWQYSSSEVQPPATAMAALGGCEAVVRRWLIRRGGSDLPKVLPDLIYGTIVPFLGQAEALRMAAEARELLASTEWADRGRE
jgi:AcrR family transcriptional regulator